MRSCLIVDDNVALVDNLTEILVERAAMAVTVAGTADEALAHAAMRRHDVALLELRMASRDGDGDGGGLLQRLRRVDPGLPLIVMTALDDEAPLRLARRHGLLALLPKPVPLPLLLELVAAARRDGLLALDDDDDERADRCSRLLSAAGFSIAAADALLAGDWPDVRPFAALVAPAGAGPAQRRLDARLPGLPALPLVDDDQALLAAVARLWSASRG